MKVIVFGYSENPDRYSHMATELLNEYKHEVIKISPRESNDLERLSQEAHTLTMYVGPELSTKFAKLLLSSRVSRVIFNPGSENKALIDAFKARNVEVVIGCTLVMLRTNQF